MENNSNRRQLFDDVFDLLSMLIGSSYVTLYDIKARLTRYSPAIVEMVGLPGEYIPDGMYNWSDYIHPEDRMMYEQAMAEMFATRQRSYDLTYRVHMADGSYSVFRFVGGILRDMEGKPSIVGGMMIHEGLMETVDRVTGMPNSSRFFQELGDAAPGRAVLLIGFGRLSHINEVYGYGYGSRLLKQVGEELRRCAEGCGEVYRMEGSRFALLLREGTEPEALYERIRESLRDHIVIDETRHNLISYGGMLRLDETTQEQRILYDCLLHACNESRTYRRGELVAYDGNRTGEAEVSETMALLGAVRSSMREDHAGFYLLYQPIYDGDGRIHGAEALLRWRSPEYGEVEPERFLSEIEQDAGFAGLGYWILRNVMDDAKLFLAKDDRFTVQVNLAASQLSDTYFADNLKGIARECGFPLEHLALELTRECRFLQDLDTVAGFTAQLKELGVKVGIDDFARGNIWLKTFGVIEPDYVKFSGELIPADAAAEKESKILRHLTELVRDCGVDVYVKQIETDEQRQIVTRMPVLGLQGWAMSAPVYYDELEELLEG